MKLNVYLTFPGNCEEALWFYRDRLGARIVGVHRFRGSPMESQVAPDALEKILHASFELGGQLVMASDAVDGAAAGPARGYALSLNLDDEAEAERLFVVLGEAGQTIMPLQETFWARRFGMVNDRFGTPWMVNCEKPMPM